MSYGVVTVTVTVQFTYLPSSFHPSFPGFSGTHGDRSEGWRSTPERSDPVSRHPNEVGVILRGKSSLTMRLGHRNCSVHFLIFHSPPTFS